MAKQSGLGFGKLLAGLTERMKKDKRFELCVYGSLVLAGILIYAVTSFPKKVPWSRFHWKSRTAYIPVNGKRKNG